MSLAAPFGGTRPLIPIGTQLNGIYEIDEPIAAGGMGEIYRGHAIQTGDAVAIKLIRSDLAESEAAFALFRKEASALHNLYHEAIVRYYVFTIDPVLERPYLAMEFVDGLSLSAMLRGGPLAFEAVYRLMKRIAAGLHAAHERGIIHRDVSPDNIIIPGGDMARAKIIDFGIARSTRLGDNSTVIGSGFAGKYLYVSPEQLGLYGGEVTPKSDIYSLGLVLAESLRSGPVDMGGNLVDVIEKRRQVPDIGPINARLRPLIEQMLQPNPVDRPQSMAEVAGWVVDATGPRTTVRASLPRTTVTGRRPDIGGRSPRLLLLGAAAAVVLAAAGATGYILSRPRPAPIEANAPPKIESGEKAPVLVEAHPKGGPASGQVASRPSPSTGTPAVKSGLAAPSKLGRLAIGPPEPNLASLIGTGPDPAPHVNSDAVTRYIAQYNGGDCFFIKPVAINDAGTTIEGFGTAAAPFHTLDEAFRQANGYEADIGMRQVSTGQCPAVTFLGRLRAAPALPRLDLATTALKVGHTLSGTVAGLDGRHVIVLLVADDGSVRNVPVTQGRTDGASFSLKMPAELGDGKLQMVVAVAGAKSLPAARGGRLPGADKVFPQMLAEAEKTGQNLGASARAFKVER